MNEKLIKLFKTKNFIYFCLLLSVNIINIALLPMYINAISVILLLLSQILIINKGLDYVIKT
jgi:hypothetical protein